MKQIFIGLFCCLLLILFVGIPLEPIQRALASGVTFPAYGIVLNNTVAVTQRNKLNLVNGGCVDNAGTGSTDCTFDVAGGTVSSVATGCGLSGGTITTSGTIKRDPVVNAQTGTSYAILNADCGTQIIFSNAGAVAISIAQAGGSGNFLTGWFVDYICTGAAGCTLTPATSTVNGAATLVLTINQSVRLWSNGANYFGNLGRSAAGITNAIGAIGSLPGSGTTTGDQYNTTDGLYRYVWNGSAWKAFFGSRLVVPPVPADFTWVNQGDASLSTASGGLTVSGPGNASTNLRIQKKTAPTAPWTATTLIAAFTGAADNHRAGILMRENATGKLLSISTGGGATSNAGIAVDRWNSATSFNAQPKATNIPVQNFQSGLWLRAVYDSTNVKFFFSPDGFIWSEYYSESKTSFFTTAPDEVGLFINVEGTGTPDLINTLIHFTF